jgi:hypothetical protein
MHTGDADGGDAWGGLVSAGLGGVSVGQPFLTRLQLHFHKAHSKKTVAEQWESLSISLVIEQERSI